jgi:hypothetical protein
MGTRKSTASNRRWPEGDGSSMEARAIPAGTTVPMISTDKLPRRGITPRRRASSGGRNDRSDPESKSADAWRRRRADSITNVSAGLGGSS